MSDELRTRFRELAARWKAQRGPHSSVQRLCDHPAYREIVAIGIDAVPLILEELRREPDHWFIALWTLTGAEPVSEENRGRLVEMARQWVEWGVANGYLSQDDPTPGPRQTPKAEEG